MTRQQHYNECLDEIAKLLNKAATLTSAHYDLVLLQIKIKDLSEEVANMKRI